MSVSGTVVRRPAPPPPATPPPPPPGAPPGAPDATGSLTAEGIAAASSGFANSVNAAQQAINGCTASALQGLIAQHQGVVGRLRDQIARRNVTISALNGAIARQNELKETPAPVVPPQPLVDVDNLNNQIKRLTDENGQLRGTVTRLNDEKDQLRVVQPSVTALNQSLTRCQSDLNDCKNASQALQRQLDGLQAVTKQTALNCAQFDSLRQAVADMKTALDKASAAAASCNPGANPTPARQGGIRPIRRGGARLPINPAAVPGLRHGQIWAPGTLF
jgi:uncharacterized phage infection (PIP) family protein YhgE